MVARRLLSLLLVLWSSAAIAAGPTRYLSASLEATARRPPSDYIDARVLVAGTEETVTAPTVAGRQMVVVFSYENECTSVYYRRSGVITVPVADVTDGTAPGRITRWPSSSRRLERSCSRPRCPARSISSGTW